MNTNEPLNLNISEVICQVVYLIKHKDNYNLAANLLLENNLSLDQLSKRTLKLSQLEIAKLTDSIIESKNS